MAGGHPTDYKPEYCEQLIKHCSEGLSFESFAGEIGVSKQTLYNWRREHREFFDSANIALEALRGFWEKAGRSGTLGQLGGWNAGSWQFIMKNFFRDEWRDKQEVEQVNTNLNMNIELTDEERANRALAILDKARARRTGQADSDSTTNPL